MAVREYIGARYIPRFCGTYDATQQYTALDVVDNGAGTSYIAKKTVPAGTPLTNAEYWAIYGAASGAILDLEDRMSSAENTIDTLNDVTIPAIESSIRNLNRKGTIVLIGDSWLANIPSIATYIGNHYNCTIKNYAVGGTGFDVANGYKDQLDVMASAPTLDLDDVRFTIISAGLNDHARGASADQFAQMFNEWKALYNTKFVGRELPPVYWMHSYSLENELTPSISGGNKTTYTTQFVYFRSVSRNIHEIRSINCFGLLPGTATAWQTDNWRHPSDAGGTALAENICRAIDGCPVVHYVYQEIDGTIDSSVVATDNVIHAKFYLVDNEMICKMDASVYALSLTPTGSGMDATFDKYFPVLISANQDFACGVKVGTHNYYYKTVSIQPDASEIRVKYADGVARIQKEFITGSLA